MAYQSSSAAERDASLSLFHLLEQDVLANPYPLYARLRSIDPVHWDPYLHAWVVTRYSDVVDVFQNFAADRTPSAEQLHLLGLEALTPLAEVMVHQMLFLDPPAHGRIRSLSSSAFTPRRVERLREHIQDIVDGLLDKVQDHRQLDIIADLANPLPAIVTAELMGLPTEDWQQLKEWSTDFAEVLGNFQHNPDRASKVLHSLAEMYGYFQKAIREHQAHPRDDLISALATAQVEGDRFTEEELVANCIVIMVGGQETTTNLIGNGLLTLFRHPDQMEQLRTNPMLIPSGVEEMLRYESPSQHTARLAPQDTQLGGKPIRQRQAVIAVMGAANHDPERFSDPDRFDVRRQDNRHLAFAWASHFCFGAPLARLEGQVAFATLLRRMPEMKLDPKPLTWRENLGLRGLNALPVAF